MPHVAVKIIHIESKYWKMDRVSYSSERYWLQARGYMRTYFILKVLRQ